VINFNLFTNTYTKEFRVVKNIFEFQDENLSKNQLYVNTKDSFFNFWPKKGFLVLIQGEI
jgi:hypothetical protein